MFPFGAIINKEKANLMNPVVLAFIGDAVYSLYIREKLSLSGDFKAGALSTMSTAYVRASAQADKVSTLMPILTEEETAIFKRARNSHKAAKAKSATVAEYNMSTGFEAVLGYLYVIGATDRLTELMNYGEDGEVLTNETTSQKTPTNPNLPQ